MTLVTHINRLRPYRKKIKYIDLFSAITRVQPQALSLICFNENLSVLTISIARVYRKSISDPTHADDTNQICFIVIIIHIYSLAVVGLFFGQFIGSVQKFVSFADKKYFCFVLQKSKVFASAATGQKGIFQRNSPTIGCYNSCIN